MAFRVFPLAVILSSRADGIHLTLHLVLAAPSAGQRQALTAAISALAVLATATGGLAVGPREEPPGHSTR